MTEKAGRENAGLDADGNLIYSEWGVQSEDAEALMADSRYSANITPCVRFFVPATALKVLYTAKRMIKK